MKEYVFVVRSMLVKLKERCWDKMDGTQYSERQIKSGETFKR